MYRQSVESLIKLNGLNELKNTCCFRTTCVKNIGYFYDLNLHNFKSSPMYRGDVLSEVETIKNPVRSGTMEVFKSKKDGFYYKSLCDNGAEKIYARTYKSITRARDASEIIKSQFVRSLPENKILERCPTLLTDEDINLNTEYIRVDELCA